MNEIKVKSTIVFHWNYDAIHARNPDGTRKYRYIINEGSSRSSKTRSLIQIVHDYASKNHSKRISVWRDTKKLCKDTILMDMTRIFPSMPFYDKIRLNISESFWTFWTDSVIEIKGTDDPDQVHGYNGDVVWVNEPYNISKDTFDQLDQRTEEFIVIDWNPKMAHFIDDLKKDPRTLVIHSTFRNNAYCPREQKIKILSYQPVKMCKIVEDKIMQEVEAKAYDIIENPLNFSDAMIKELSRCKENERKGSASAFKWSVYGLGKKAEKPNRIFFWEEITDDYYHTLDAVRYYGVDWGTVDPWGILEAKYYDGALYFHQLNYDSENEIKEKLTPHEMEEVSRGFDPDDPENQGGIVKWKFTKLNIPKNAYQICDTNRPIKLMALHKAGWDYAVTAPKPPGSIVDGIDLLSDMKCYYTASSTNLKYEQENYEREVDRYGIVMDEPVDKDNHLMDPARYIALFLSLMGIIKR
jgi:phage terminase large subunit